MIKTMYNAEHKLSVTWMDTPGDFEAIWQKEIVFANTKEDVSLVLETLLNWMSFLKERIFSSREQVLSF